MTDDPHDWLGAQLAAGRYRVNAKLGEGGMGAVYRAHDANLDCDVVIKVPHPLMLQQREFAQRFAQEIRSLVALSHPHIVKIIDVGERQGTPFAVMAYLAGGDLQERRPQDDRGKPSPMTAESLTEWLPAVAKALDFVHNKGYVHRDIKPANIIFDENGNAHVSDFGIVKAFADASAAEPDNGLTGAGMVLGTADYMAPEVVMADEYDGRADQYSLAVTIYELLCARQPFTAATPHAVLLAKATDRAPALASVAPSLPRPLCEAVDRALSKDPQERFASCSEFAEAALSGSYDKTLKVWDLPGHVKRTLTGHTSYVFGLAITANGRTAISGSYDKTLKVWDLRTGMETDPYWTCQRRDLRGDFTRWPDRHLRLV